jgi:hypothetical protein
MDPVTLASAATAILAPVLTKFGENFAEDAGKKLWDTIAGKFQDKPAAAGAASEFAAKADDADNQEAFTLQLKKALKEDAEFAQQIAKLVDHYRENAGGISNIKDSTIATEGSIATGSVQTGDINGNFVIGNQNTISQTTIEKDNKADLKKNNGDES